jgi:hypothetical protein
LVIGAQILVRAVEGHADGVAGRRSSLGASVFATVDQSLMRGSSRLIWFVAGLPCTEHECGPKPLQDEVKGSPDLRPAPRLMRRMVSAMAGWGGGVRSGSRARRCGPGAVGDRVRPRT